MKRTILQKAAAAALFMLLTAALLAAADFLLVDDVHSYSRVMLQELYADAGNIDTLFLGSSHCYRSVDPAQVDAALGTHSFNAGSSQQLPDGSYYMLKEAAAQNPLKTVYLEMFYTGYNESASANIPLACYLLADHMDWRSPNRYAYLSEMGGLAAYADLLLPARHGIASPSSMPALWKAKLTDGYTPDSYGYVTYPDSGEAYRGRGFVYTLCHVAERRCRRAIVGFWLGIPQQNHRFLRGKRHPACAVHGPAAQRLPVQHRKLSVLRRCAAKLLRRA